MTRWTPDKIPTQEGRIAIVTGANSGIGFETARELARKGAEVILACRSETRGQDALERLQEEQPEAKAHFIKLDLGDLDQVKAFSDEVHERFERVDLLINNAGVMVPPAGKTKQGFELQFGVNHLGHFALTLRLLDLLTGEGARVVNVASMAHTSGTMDFDDLHSERKPYKAWAVYGQSKLANLLFSAELQRRAKDAGLGLTVASAHPGWTRTNLQQNMLVARIFNPFIAMPTAQGALPTLFAATDPSIKGDEYIGPNGFREVRGYPGKAKRSAAAQNARDAERLFEVSETLTGVEFQAPPVVTRRAG